jgi:membrane-bound inhibitor of C-type lysozyme
MKQFFTKEILKDLEKKGYSIATLIKIFKKTKDVLIKDKKYQYICVSLTIINNQEASNVRISYLSKTFGTLSHRVPSKFKGDYWTGNYVWWTPIDEEDIKKIMTLKIGLLDHIIGQLEENKKVKK